MEMKQNSLSEPSDVHIDSSIPIEEVNINDSNTLPEIEVPSLENGTDFPQLSPESGTGSLLYHVYISVSKKAEKRIDFFLLSN